MSAQSRYGSSCSEDSSLSPSVRGRNRTPPHWTRPHISKFCKTISKFHPARNMRCSVASVRLNTTSLANSQPETKHNLHSRHAETTYVLSINQYTSVYTARNHVMCVHLPICDVIEQLSGQAGGAEWGSGPWGAHLPLRS